MKQKGMTLIELVTTIGIMAIIGGLLLVIVVNSTGLFTKESSKLTQGLNTNDALTSLRTNIKDASTVIFTYASPSKTYTSGDTQLILQSPSIDSSNNFILNYFDTYVYFLDGNRLRFKLFPSNQSTRKSQDQILSTVIDSLKFQYLNSDKPPVETTPVHATKIRITLTLKQKTGANYETNVATTEANLRNK